MAPQVASLMQAVCSLSHFASSPGGVVVVVVVVGFVVAVVVSGAGDGVVTGIVVSAGWPFPQGQSLRCQRSLGTCAHVATASPVPGALQTECATLSL
jgi:hypothetical protein